MYKVFLALFAFACAPKAAVPVVEPMLEQPPVELPDPTDEPGPGEGKPRPN